MTPTWARRWLGRGESADPLTGFSAINDPADEGADAVARNSWRAERGFRFAETSYKKNELVGQLVGRWLKAISA